MRLKAFTLAEVLITLAIIGVVAALSIPAVISNSQQQEFKTGLRKAVSVLNSAITMNMALDGESPYDNANLFGYLMKHMSVVKTTTNMADMYWQIDPHGYYANSAFYTTDGMRFEIRWGYAQYDAHPLYENPNVYLCTKSMTGATTSYWEEDEGREISSTEMCGGCGAYGLNSNVDNTTKPPCMISVDVNGDRKPTPANVNCHERTCWTTIKYSDALGLKLTDIFTIMITDKAAMPYGVAAQRAMYQARK